MNSQHFAHQMVPLDSPDARAAFEDLDQHSLFNWYTLHQHLAHLYRDHMMGPPLVSIGRHGQQTLWAIPIAQDLVKPEYQPSYNYLASIINVPVLNVSYPISNLYWDSLEDDPFPHWASFMPRCYIDGDIAPMPFDPPNAFMDPGCAIEIPDDPETVWQEYSRTTRKGFRRNLRVLDECHVSEGTIEDLRTMLPHCIDIWEGRDREANARLAEEGLPPLPPHMIPIDMLNTWVVDTLALIDTHPHSRVRVIKVIRDGELVAVNAVVLRSHNYGVVGELNYADDYLVWRRPGDRTPYGTALWLYNMQTLAPGTIYSMGSPKTSGELIPHQEYKLALAPEALRIPQPHTAKFPTRQFGLGVGFFPPFFADTGLIEE